MSMATKYLDSDFMAAIRETQGTGRGQVARIAAAVGCSEATVRSRLRKLSAAGRVTVQRQRTYDSQPNTSWMFGGAGVCVRNFLTASITVHSPCIEHSD